MAAYTLHVDANARPGDRSALERAEVIRDGFSWGAFLTQPIWFLWHRLWIAALVDLLCIVGLATVCHALHVSDDAFALAQLALAYLVGLEANTIRAWTLKRHGRPVVDTAMADDRESAEARLFARWLERTSASRSAPPPQPAARPSHPVVGLFPEPEAGP